MCSFNIIKKIINDIKYINYHTQKRGPDKTTIKTINKITFIHNLLHITGKLTEQPFIKNNVVCVYNGEIYNYKEFGNYNSDGMCLIDLYLKYDIKFTNKLDGEFAIAMIDFNKNIIILSTDIFSTKPLFYCFEEENFMISSYKSCIERNNMKNIIKLKANTTIVFDLNNNQQINELNVYQFNLEQYKTTYDDWIKAFEKAVDKRTNTDKNVFVSMSSGYDSGAICCSLNNLRKKYKTYTVYGQENKNVIHNRIKINNTSNQVFKLNKQIINEYKKINRNNCCDFIGYPRKKNTKKIYKVLKDNASNGASFIYKNARNDNYFISLSGQGADEIISDYGFNGRKKTWHSCFGGKFPQNLENIFPWESVFTGIGECLIMKEEIIGGSHGIEVRYPFLDKDVVQEFLNLTPELKNKWYKAPLHYYLSNNNYPFAKNEKIGFNRLF